MQHPFACIVAGVKSISPPPQRIIWCYGQWQPSYFDMMKTMPGIEFNEGIPEDIDNGDYLDVSKRNLIILDDLMAQSGKDKRIADLFTKGSHHRNLSIIYIVQNIFHQGKEMRNISLNAHYIVLFKSPRDKQGSARVYEELRRCHESTSWVLDVGFKVNNRRSTTTQEQRTSRRDCKVFTQTVVSSATTCKCNV
jgi:hypothetical protein